MKIDVHAHYLPVSFVDLETVDPAAHHFGVRIAQPDSGEVLFTAVEITPGYEPEQIFDLDRRRRDMQRQGVDLHVLSAPPPFNFFVTLEPNKALTICRLLNEAFARTAADDPAHFVSLATVPLQAPELAAGELERAVRELGLRGVEIGTNVDGKNLDEPGLHPFYEKAQELDVPIFIHSTGKKLGGERLGSYHLGNLIGNPTEDALAAASLIFGGVLQEFPRLKVYIAHGGGSCPLLRGRWDHGWRVRPEAKLHIQRPPSEYFGQLMFDSLTHSGPALNYLVETVGPDHVMLGTDYPYDMSDTDPVRGVDALPHLSDRERELIFGGNAAALFGLDR